MKRAIPLPIPAGVYGLLLMLLALSAGVIKPQWVEDAALFLIGLLQLIFIPPAVGLLASYAEFGGILAQSLAVIVFSTAAVVALTGLAVQGVQRIVTMRRGISAREKEGRPPGAGTPKRAEPAAQDRGLPGDE